MQKDQLRLNSDCKNIIVSLVKKLVNLLNLGSVKNTVDQVINEKYMDGMEDMEVQLDMNFNRDAERTKFLKDFTFQNIKGMTDEMSEKLRKEMSMGLMNLEGVSQLKKRVQGVMDVSASRAAMIARTEANRAENWGRLDAGLQSPIELVKWIDIVEEPGNNHPISVLMKKEYGSLDKAIPLTENFKVNYNGKIVEGPSPPFHPNERDSLMINQAPDDADDSANA